MPGRTVYDKIWDAHAVAERGDGMTILYIDRHLLHEVTSPQAFEGLRLAGREPWRRGANLATPDHNVPTTNRAAGIRGIEDPIAKAQVVALDENCKRFDIPQFEMTDVRQGIVHVVGPEQGATLPGMTIVCGDSHTSTHGAFAALAHGIGTSEVEHVLATQCLPQRKSRNMRIVVDGELGRGVGAKDLVLAIIRQVGTAGATGHAVEYAGSAVQALSMEGRMTLCNMSIEAGARAGLVAVDDATVDYLRGRPFSPAGAAWEQAERDWRNMRIVVDGELGRGVGAKDLVLAIIRQVGTAGATGHAVEYAGSAVQALSMEGRMTLCNMSIEAGARAGLVAVDDATVDYLRGRPFSPAGAAWEQAERDWRTLVSDTDACFDAEVVVDAATVAPQVSWGTSPELVLGIDERVPEVSSFAAADKRELCERSLAYMDLKPGTPIAAVPVDKVFIGSCTNGRIEDLRSAAAVLDGRKVAASVMQAMAVPGSGLVKRQAEAEGLDAVFKSAGFEWRDPGCSMCLAMNDDRLGPGERAAATSNRNFEGRQGYRGRTHLVSPAMAAAAAVAGRFADVREFL